MTYALRDAIALRNEANRKVDGKLVHSFDASAALLRQAEVIEAEFTKPKEDDSRLIAARRVLNEDNQRYSGQSVARLGDHIPFVKEFIADLWRALG